MALPNAGKQSSVRAFAVGRELQQAGAPVVGVAAAAHDACRLEAT